MLEASSRAQPVSRINGKQALDEVLRLGRDEPQLRQAVELVVAGQNFSHRSEPVAAVEGALSTGDEHVSDDANAPAVGRRCGVPKIPICRGAAIAQWKHQCLPYCHPRFESLAHNLRFYKFLFLL